MKLVDKESGKILRVPLLQPQAVQVEYEKWRKENHPRFWIIKYMFIFTLGFLIAEWQTNKYPLMEKLALVILLICTIIWIIYDRQYNKQAPEGLKRR